MKSSRSSGSTMFVGAALLGLPLLLVGIGGSGVGMVGGMVAICRVVAAIVDTHGAMALMASISVWVRRPALKKLAWVSLSVVFTIVWQNDSTTCVRSVCVELSEAGSYV